MDDHKEVKEKYPSEVGELGRKTIVKTRKTCKKERHGIHLKTVDRNSHPQSSTHPHSMLR